MAQSAQAVICRELGKAVRVERITVASPQRGEVMVKIAACGVCHSDLSATNGTISMKLPLILGHEAAGEVIEVGEDAGGLVPGDHVVSSFIYMCGSGCGVMAEYATLSVENVVKIDRAVPLDRAPLVGCAVTTGVGAVFNTARVVPGSSVVVSGCGGIGLNVIQGARIAGAGRIIAVDTLSAKLDMAVQFGATDTMLAASGQDLVKPLKQLTGRGPDYAFECVGNGELAALSFRTIARGGLAVVVGSAKPSDSTSVRTMTLPCEEKTLTGSFYGSCIPRIDFPRMLALYAAGRLKLDELITRRYRIGEAAEAFADLESCKNARGIIEF